MTDVLLDVVLPTGTLPEGPIPLTDEDGAQIGRSVQIQDADTPGHSRVTFEIDADHVTDALLIALGADDLEALALHPDGDRAHAIENWSWSDPDDGA